MARRVLLALGTAVVGVGASGAVGESLMTSKAFRPVAVDDFEGRKLNKYHLNPEFQPGPARPVFPDTWDPFCDVGMKCSAGQIPKERGLCVLVGDSRACWDACNTKHAPEDYRVGTNPVNNSAFEEMVRMVRDGENPYARCPEGTLQAANAASSTLCTAGNRCNSGDIPENRGMCVHEENTNSQVCVDMCDMGKTPNAYVMGTGDNTKATVTAVRDGSDGLTNCKDGWLGNWPWIVLAIVLIALCVCCAWVWMNRSQRRMKGRGLEQHTMPPMVEEPVYMEPMIPERMPEPEPVRVMEPEPVVEMAYPTQESQYASYPAQYPQQQAFMTRPLQTISTATPQYRPVQTQMVRQLTAPAVSPFTTQTAMAYGGYNQGRPF